MAYMSRLGIWGPSTQFPTFHDFIKAVERRYTHFIHVRQCMWIWHFHIHIRVHTCMCTYMYTAVMLLELCILCTFSLYRGVGAMEIVAMDMKVTTLIMYMHSFTTMYIQLRGMYTARQLSFTGVTFDIRDVPLSEKFIEMYDSSVEMVR